MRTLRRSSFRGIVVPAAALVAILTAAASTVPAAADLGPETATTVSTVSASSPSSTFFVTSSTSGLGSQFIDCSWDVIVPDGASVSALRLDVDGHSAFDPGLAGCEVVQQGPLAGLSLDVEGYFASSLEGIDEPLAPGTTLLHCSGTDLVERGDWDDFEIDFEDLDTYALGANSLDGTPVQPPRLCATNMECESDGTADLAWKAEPECGDADYDTQVKSGDALVALQAAVGLSSCLPFPASCDTDSNGMILAPDALRILQRSVGLEVVLQCPVACHPGTIGPPGEDRMFTVTVSVTGIFPTALTFRMTPDDGKFLSPGEVECIRGTGVNHSVSPEGVVLAVAQSGARPVLYCRYRGAGSVFPEAADFTIVTTDASENEVEGAVRITSIRYGW